MSKQMGLKEKQNNKPVKNKKSKQRLILNDHIGVFRRLDLDESDYLLQPKHFKETIAKKQIIQHSIPAEVAGFIDHETKILRGIVNIEN